MRKRAQLRSRTILDEPSHIAMKPKIIEEEKSSKWRFKIKNNWWITISLIVIFLLILFLNTYYNATSDISIDSEGGGLEKYYLSGPDPYYNMRLVEKTHETGRYPYYTEADPLLNYPIGRSGARPPLFNMMALGFSRILVPFMDEIDAIGYSMQFVPALFGALLIFPVYFIGKEVFNKKAGLIAALFVAIIPIHLGSGHGSAYTLFDHDSFNLLLFFIIFLFLIKSVKEKDSIKSLLYAILGGVALAALSMAWVKSQQIYAVIAIYTIVTLFINIARSKSDFNFIRNMTVIMFTGYLVSLPVITAGYGSFSPDVNTMLCLIVLIFGLICYFFKWQKIPWTISIPGIFILVIIGLIAIHPLVLPSLAKHIPILSDLDDISTIIYGAGIYGNKVSMTVAEANTYQISYTVMSFGPALYWVGWAGFLFLLFFFYKNMDRRDYLFLIVLFFVNIWLTGIAGRFTNDMVPVIALLAGWIVWMLLDKIDYKQMIRNIRSAGGGFHGIRKGVKFLHIFGICFIAFLVLLPGALLAFDAAVPVNAPTQDGKSDLKSDLFGEDHSGAFGMGVGKEIYWTRAFKWLNEQDQDILNPADRPGFISWWDYGFYEVAIGGHPTVADNFQDGIPPAGNFHTATSEEEAVAVLITRLLEADAIKNNGKLSGNVKSALSKNIGVDNASKIAGWIENPKTAPSYHSYIQPEYNQYIREEINEEFLKVGYEYIENAAYHNISDFLTNKTTGFSDEIITNIYHDVQEATGWSIRYYGVEGYDKQIFNIFAFLSDKSLLMVGAPKDDFVEVTITGYRIDPNTKEKIEGMDWEMTLLEYLEMDDKDKQYMVPTDQGQNFLDPYFDTMFYRTYFGPGEYQSTVQIPCTGMKHFYAEYISDLSKPSSQYYQGIAAVVIAKYYEGAVINGSLLFNDSGTLGPMNAQAVITKELAYTNDTSYNITHDKMDTIKGNFSLLAGAGSVLKIIRYPEIDTGIPWYGIPPFVIKEIDLNISDDDAMRKTNVSKWQIDLGNITIDPANISGYIFDNLDDNATYNVSSDKPIYNVSISLYGISKLKLNTDEKGNIIGLSPAIDEQTGYPKFDFYIDNSTDENGSYSITGLKPGYYVMETKIDGIPIDESLIPLKSGNLSGVNISKPKDASVEGYVYYDDNKNDKQDSGEAIPQATVKIFYDSPSGTKKFINETITDGKGFYSFGHLIPGNISGREINTYTINISKLPEYHSEVTISPVENKTTSFNISVDLAPVKVTGSTKYNNEVKGSIEIKFTKDGSIKNNTAETDSVTTNTTTGYYTIDLTPGTYNVTVEEKEGDTIVYTYDAKLNITKGQDPIKNYDIILTKKTVTITGHTKDDDGPVGGISILYEPNGSIVGNTAAKPGTSTSNETTGFYSIELKPGYYNITASKKEGQTLVYYCEMKEHITNDSKTVDIIVAKKSVTVSGTVKYNGIKQENITVSFEKNELVKNNSAVPTSVISDKTGSYSVEVTPGSYNITASKYQDSTLVYQYTGSEDIKENISTYPLDITVSKKSASLSGTVTYNGIKQENIQIYFTKNESRVDNKADDYVIAASDKNGNYNVEIAPGYYNVTAFSDIFNDTGVNYTYINTNDSNNYEAKEEYILTDDKFNIKLEMKEIEEE